MKQELEKLLKTIASEMGINKPVILTDAKGHADFATNLALMSAKDLGKKPIEIANEIKEKLNASFIKKVEVAGPGFINIFLNSESFGKLVQEIIDKGNKYGSQEQGQYINIEYISANPTGYLHLGHARNASLGLIVARALQFAGNKVDQEYWINDAGSQMDNLAISLFVRYQQIFGSDIQLPEESYKGQDIVELADLFLEEFGDEYNGVEYTDEVKAVFKKEGTRLALDKIKEHIALLGINMDIWVSEQSVHDSGALVEYIEKLDGTYEKDGALWLSTTDYGDDKDRVIRKSNGSYTYFAPDIAYHNMKYDRGYDKLINVWGGDHLGYVARVKTALQLSGQDPEKLTVLTIQMVKLMKDGKELKMSKRMGTSFTIKELVELIGKDATIYNMISRTLNAGVVFDVNEVIKKSSDNPLFSIQYSHARMCKLLNNSKVEPKVGQYEDEKEVALINVLTKFPGLIDTISKSYAVHLLTSYALEVSGAFNSWYSNSKIIGSDREAEMTALVIAARQVLRNVLGILDIDAPESM